MVNLKNDDLKLYHSTCGNIKVCFFDSEHNYEHAAIFDDIAVPAFCILNGSVHYFIRTIKKIYMLDVQTTEFNEKLVQIPRYRDYNLPPRLCFNTEFKVLMSHATLSISKTSKKYIPVYEVYSRYNDEKGTYFQLPYTPWIRFSKIYVNTLSKMYKRIKL